ncbi:hypothetical protein D9M68_485170 [compost metagenome]
MLVSSSMLAAVCCSDEACSSVRCDRSVLPAAIWLVPDTIDSVPARTWRTMRRILAFMSANACNSWPVSSRLSTSMRLVRSPEATVRATATARCSGRVMPLVSQTENAMPIPSTTTPSPIRLLRALA